METVYTEKMLKAVNKPELLEIAAANGIEVVDGTKNDDIRALIFAKGCPVMENTETPAQIPGNSATAEELEDESVPKFSKEQLLKSNWYSHRRDILTALLEDGKMYSHAAVTRLIKDFFESKVK